METIEFLINSPHKGETFIIVIAAVLCVQFLIKLYDWIIQRFGISTKGMRREQMQTEAIEKLKEEVDTIKTEQTGIKEIICKLDKDITYMQQKQDETDRSRIKDRISQMYRYYKEKKEWTSMEKEAFDDLIKSYEAAGGKNSFLHTVCVPASEEWSIVDQ